MEFMKCGRMPNLKVIVQVQPDGTISEGGHFFSWMFCKGDPGPTPSHLKKSHVMLFRAILYFAALV